MVRWQPDARERLQAAALELYASNGFEETTVADIARAVGLTERTFFRHFVDKREVIFAGQDEFRQAFTDVIAESVSAESPLEIVTSAVLAAAQWFPDERRPHSRLRQTVIVAHPELQERELLKMSALATSLAAALRERGIPEPSATLAAESGVTVFRLSFEQWIAQDEARSLVDIEREIFLQLRSLTA
jgi:AcrR family transcriptional regulator